MEYKWNALCMSNVNRAAKEGLSKTCSFQLSDACQDYPRVNGLITYYSTMQLITQIWGAPRGCSIQPEFSLPCSTPSSQSVYVLFQDESSFTSKERPTQAPLPLPKLRSPERIKTQVAHNGSQSITCMLLPWYQKTRKHSCKGLHLSKLLIKRSNAQTLKRSNAQTLKRSNAST